MAKQEGAVIANIRKELGRHDWVRVKLQSPIESAYGGVGRNLSPGWLCKNCRQHAFTDDPPEVVGCLTDIKVSRVGSSRQHDYLQQEERLRNQQNDREIQEEMALGLRDRQGRPVIG